MDQKKIGMFLKILRKEKCLTQEQLAEFLNVSGRTVSRWETGINMPDFDILITLSEYYNVDIREILDGERKKEESDSIQSDAVSYAADYGRLKEKLLLRKLILILITGFSSWVISLITMMLFLDSVTGAVITLVITLISVILYSLFMLTTKANRSINGFINCIISTFIAITASNCIIFLVFFGKGSYHNYGIVGMYYYIFIILAVFIVTGITVTLINKRRRL
ncbi:MAG: helix-turn-helix transcriptional regulator [Ruminococcaceae bacterium]|nr:helix-turn-helix transcriptional regulator [Oscillospiraceae bacterium]MBR3595472.1 helix-turn-helix transcriptional regulator [Clostridia bacterium]